MTIEVTIWALDLGDLRPEALEYTCAWKMHKYVSI